jgi:hypothetical protein
LRNAPVFGRAPVRASESTTPELELQRETRWPMSSSQRSQQADTVYIDHITFTVSDIGPFRTNTPNPR